MAKSGQAMVETSPAASGGSGERADPLLAVCCQGSDEIRLYELDRGEPCGQIPVGGHPVHVTVDAGHVFVATMDERSVTVIDTDGDINRLEIGVLGPSHFAHSADYLFVTCTGGDVVAAIDPVHPAVHSRIHVGAEPHEIAAHDGTLYVGSRREGVVSRIDATSCEALDEIQIGERARVEDISLAPAPGFGYAVDRAGDRLVRFSLDGRVMGEVDVPGDPFEVKIVDDRILVPAPNAGTVHEFDLSLESRILHEGFEQPVGISELGGIIRVLDRHRPTLVGLDGTEIATSAGALAGLETRSGLVLSHYDDATISCIDPSGTVRWRQQTGNNPLGALVI